LYGDVNILLNLHHYLGLINYAWLALSGCGYMLSGVCLSLEMSTPFSCLCWVGIKLGYGNSIPWKINQFVLLHAFHLRNVVECYVWYLSYQNWTVIWKEMNIVTFVLLYIGLSSVTFAMTPIWTYKKTVQFVTGGDWNFKSTKSDHRSVSESSTITTEKKVNDKKES